MKNSSQARNNGIRFEIFLQHLLVALDMQQVMRNVIYTKPDGSRNKNGTPKYVSREIDLQYNLVKEGELYLVAVEAKYSSNGCVPHLLDQPKKKESRLVKHIDNVVDETVERMLFTNFDTMHLVTNKKFQKNTHRRAREVDKILAKGGKRFYLIEGDQLERMYFSVRDKMPDYMRRRSLEAAINSVRCRTTKGNYHVKKNIINMENLQMAQYL